MLSVSSAQVVFEALKNGGLFNDIALDDITLTSGPCGPDPPEPTNVPPPTTVPPMPGYLATTSNVFMWRKLLT